MKKLEVNHTPEFSRDIAIALSVLWLILMFIICCIMTKLIAVFLSIVILLIIIGIGWYIDSRKTTVEYDTNKVKWKWLFLEYTADFNKVDSVHYTIVHERTRYGYTHRFEIVFQLTDSMELRLNDRLELNDIDNSINGVPDNIKLMQLYRFIENVYPEKCTGFIKNDTY
ncbi:MAG: hypothetical protein K2J39_00495 [Ruminococcus sp.]|nr:hypothetical protein [Ruminococcus sp.]